jgi:hypothetical protein
MGSEGGGAMNAGAAKDSTLRIAGGSESGMKGMGGGGGE